MIKIKLRFLVPSGCVHAATCRILFVRVLQNRYKQHFFLIIKLLSKETKGFYLKYFTFLLKKKKRKEAAGVRITQHYNI